MFLFFNCLLSHPTFGTGAIGTSGVTETGSESGIFIPIPFSTDVLRLYSNESLYRYTYCGNPILPVHPVRHRSD